MELFYSKNNWLHDLRASLLPYVISKSSTIKITVLKAGFQVQQALINKSSHERLAPHTRLRVDRLLVFDPTRNFFPLVLDAGAGRVIAWLAVTTLNQLLQLDEDFARLYWRMILLKNGKGFKLVCGLVELFINIDSKLKFITDKLFI